MNIPEAYPVIHVFFYCVATFVDVSDAKAKVTRLPKSDYIYNNCLA